MLFYNCLNKSVQSRKVRVIILMAKHLLVTQINFYLA